MGIGDWFKKTFGKQACSFCGAEVGMLKRSKIKNGDFICTDCSYTCSPYIQKYRFTREELLGHMEYMKRQAKLLELVGAPSRVVPSCGKRNAIEFYDDFGMFRIRDWDKDRHYAKELLRYDQVAKYEAFCDESEPSEAGKPKEFDRCGVRITLVGAQDDGAELKRGLRAHPYIDEVLEIEVNNDDKKVGMLDVEHILRHFDYIFGVHDDTKGLFNFGPTKQQRREGEAVKAMGGVFAAAIKAAKDGQVSDEAQQQVRDAMNKVEDAATGGLGEYSRRADAAEVQI